MRMFRYQSDDLRFVQLLIDCPPITQLYYIPFAILYSIWFSVWFTKIGFDDHLEFGIIGLFIIVLLHVVFSLFSYWSLTFRIFVKYKRTDSSSVANFVHVIPKDNNGIPEIVPLQHKFDRKTKKRIIYFIFQRLLFYIDDEEKIVKPVNFPLNLQMNQYASHKGFESQSEIDASLDEFGLNDLTHELPPFRELFIERATAPFFCFQVFCVLLWCIDEYWAYPMVTLAMLVLFEVNLVAQQLRNIKTIQSMEMKPYRLYAYREKRWQIINSSNLLPGDIVSIPVSDSNRVIPCDLLILKGSCIVDESMLTGESVPVIKENIDIFEKDDYFSLDNSKKNVVLFGGTKSMQTTPPEKSQFPKPPDNGCICYVLRTGLSTSQGNLLKTIMFSVKTVTANNFETFLFILFLLGFALAASIYVWIEGGKDPKRNRYKLFIECTVILTSVIPQELPIELALAVNSSLVALSKYAIFCTEPFRIPFAGKVDFCCFDKTGTLTEDSVIVEGVSCLPDQKTNTIVEMKNCPIESLKVLVTAHSLAFTDQGIVGDPLEKAVLEWSSFSINRDGSIYSKTFAKLSSFKIYAKFPFTSALRRMSVVMGHQNMSSPEFVYSVCVKGSPEVIKDMLINPPADYDEGYLTMARRGARVLALAYKDLGTRTGDEIRNMKRGEAESNLKFAGFIILSCPLKRDSLSTVVYLKEASHYISMITGDNPLTACYVGKLLKIYRTDNPVLIMTKLSNGQEDANEKWEWRSVDDSSKFIIDSGEDVNAIIHTCQTLYMNHEFCITGEGLEWLDRLHPRVIAFLLPKIRIFARMSPAQKESIVCQLKSMKYTVLMCGDGTNDVGALKHSHVGISIVNAPAKNPMNDEPARPQKVDDDRHLTPSERHLKNMRKRREDLLAKAMSQQDDDQQIVRMGDASIASPFIIKTASPLGVCRIIEQGRCTLVITLQMFKILAINALISAYSLSFLFLKGFKPSEMQAIFQVFLLSGSFLFISNSKPLKKLSRERPLPNIFNFYTIATVTLQFLVHFYVLTRMVHESEARMPKLKEDEFIDLKAEFKPSIFNTCVYLISTALQATTLMVNYKGNPFMISFYENKPLFTCVMSAFVGVFALSLGFGSDFLSLLPLEDDLRWIFHQMFFLDLFGCLTIDRVLSYLFGYGRLKNI